jgi:hypothetical protein
MGGDFEGVVVADGSLRGSCRLLLVRIRNDDAFMG